MQIASGATAWGSSGMEVYPAAPPMLGAKGNVSAISVQALFEEVTRAKSGRANDAGKWP
jgi:hypothetical protein